MILYRSKHWSWLILLHTGTLYFHQMTLLRSGLLHPFLPALKKFLDLFVAPTRPITSTGAPFSIQHVLCNHYFPVTLYVLPLLTLSLRRGGILVAGLVWLFEGEAELINEVLWQEILVCQWKQIRSWWSLRVYKTRPLGCTFHKTVQVSPFADLWLRVHGQFTPREARSRALRACALSGLRGVPGKMRASSLCHLLKQIDPTSGLREL